MEMFERSVGRTLRTGYEGIDADSDVDGVPNLYSTVLDSGGSGGGKTAKSRKNS